MRPSNREAAYLLSGIRVVDLSMGWSGPLAARHLADMGAEVIKIEACQYYDWWRGWDLTPEEYEERMYEQAPAFNLMNRNKKGITLDLTTPEGKALCKRLVGISDVVIENQARSVLPKLGLDYPDLIEVKPDLVMISLPAFGATGDWTDYRAYGSTVEQASGIPHLTGEPDWPPTMQHVAYGDSVAGINAAAALLVALWHRENTGEGQYIDLSQVECLFPLASHGIIEQSMNGKVPKRHGNGHPVHSPHGVFPCQGDDRWVIITITNTKEWRGLCREMDRPDLSEDKGLDTSAGRRAREKEINEIIRGWTSELDPQTIMFKLQENGVPAAPVHPPYTLMEEPHLYERGTWEWLDRAYVDMQPQTRPLYHISKGLRGIETPAPCLGEHNEEILGGLLGLSKEELALLEEKGIIGTVPTALEELRKNEVKKE